MVFVILLCSRLLRYVLTMVVCMCFMFVFICALFMVLGVVLCSVWFFFLLICDVCSWRCSFMGNLCVSSCRCFVLVSVVHPVAILSAVFCVIRSLFKFVFDASGDHIVKRYSSIGLVMALYVASTLSICIVLRAFVVVFVVCEFGVESDFQYFALMFMVWCGVYL